MMNRQTLSVVGLSLVTGVVGGVVSSWVFGVRPVLAQRSPPSVKVLRTERLEIVNKQGKVCATLEALPNGYPRLLIGDPEKGAAVTANGIVFKDGTEYVGLGPLAGTTGALGRLGLTVI